MSPAAIAIERNVAVSAGRAGNPKETFEAPRQVFRPSSPLTSRIVSSVTIGASGLVETAIANGSIRMSSAGMP